MTITGTGLGYISSTTFNGVAALSITSNGTDNSFMALTPRGTVAGAVDVVVGTSAGGFVTAAGGFTYTSP